MKYATNIGFYSDWPVKNITTSEMSTYIVVCLIESNTGDRLRSRNLRHLKASLVRERLKPYPRVSEISRS